MTYQSERRNRALETGFFRPYELSFQQLIIWAKKFAGLIPYRNKEAAFDGDWSVMFERNELVVCAAVLSTDETELKKQFKRSFIIGEQEGLAYILHLFNLLDSWYQNLPSSPALSHDLKLSLLGHYQTELCKPLAHLYQCTPKNLHSQFEHLDSLWQLPDHTLTEHTVTASSSIHEESLHCFSKILSVISDLKQECRETFDKSQHHGEHPPQIALYLAFLKLFERAQLKINEFTDKHLQFYYRDVLAQKPLLAPEEPIYLKLTQNKASNTAVFIGKDHIFTPGNTTTFEPIIYRSAYSMEITDAEIDRVFNLTFRRNPLISPETELGLISGVSQHKASATPEPSEGKSKQTKSFEIFGHSANLDESQSQQMGLIISDPLFSLENGFRELTLQFELQEVGSSQLYQRLSEFYLQYVADTQSTTIEIQPDDNGRQLADDAIELVVNEIIQLQASVLGDWLYNIPMGRLLAKVNSSELVARIDEDATLQTREAYRCVLLALLDDIANNPSPEASTTSQKECFFKILGQLVVRYALTTGEWLTSEDKNKIFSLTQTLINQKTIDETVEDTLALLLNHSRIHTFYQLFENAFEAYLSTEQGWEMADHAQFVPIENNTNHQMGGELNLRLEPGFPKTAALGPDVHNSEGAFKDPAIKLSLKAQSNCFAYSVFSGFEFSGLRMACNVSGVTQLQLFNQDGQADPSQPFFPLGAQPNEGSYLVIAGKELASKPLRHLDVNLEWSGLPGNCDGFRSHYAEYSYDYSNHSFKVTAEVLNNGGWEKIGQHQHTLFSPKTGPLERNVTLSFGSVRNSYTPNRHDWPALPYGPQSSIRNGLFKITLSAPSTAFGHNEYGLVLSKTLSQNVKAKNQQPLPKAPYTPKLNRISVSYSALQAIDLGDMSAKNQCRIVHLHPFGSVDIYPRNNKHKFAYPRLLPQYAEDGHLMVGIKGAELSGYLNLYFLLNDDSKLLTPYPSSESQWYYLVGDHWLPLPAKHIIHDTTHGFLTSGIITLDIPERIDTVHNVMPSGLFWIRVSTNRGINLYPKCHQIATHVIQVTGEMQSDSTLSDFATWQSLPMPANLGAITQLTPFAHQNTKETHKQWVIRTSELLRHKGKAITPWDYERLVLQQFPEVDSATCFPARRYNSGVPCPGKVLITVIPKERLCEHNPCKFRRLDSATLMKIRDYLAHIARSHSRIEVRNAGYETIQIRCSVTFLEGVHHGLAIRRLEYAVMEALCPWNPEGMNQGLGWELSLTKLSAFIRKQDNVTNVSGLSVLKISHLTTNHYELQDSARNDEPIKAQLPWYILVPAAHHFITIAPASQRPAPVPAGVGNLVIGEQFIIDETPTPGLSRKSSGQTSSTQNKGAD
ncbi:hypothetical protein [Vibrio hangzhouensis]|uniref:Baseplate J-like protein n=1 Tax=Vibrio hangzhouensis TaxID=462991 RepID=A0A1H5S084_9VIBR|nr:hypothetical protein [Vibrio hangzhouensis]SEF43900.1 hypothetical protein SAMN04488244_101193 [Vibrio hangzhouensis]